MLILCSLPDFQLAVSLDFLYIWNWSPRLNFNPTGEVSERALREIYLKPFQIAIKHSNPWALMTA